MSATDMWAAEMDDEQVGVPEPKPRTYRVKVHEWPLPFDRRFDRSKKRSAPAAVGAAPERDLTIQQRRRNGGAA